MRLNDLLGFVYSDPAHRGPVRRGFARRGFAHHFAPRLAGLLLIAGLLPQTTLWASDWPTITDVDPNVVQENDDFTIHGHNIEGDVLDYVVVIRDPAAGPNEPGGAATTITHLDVSNSLAGNDQMTVRLDPIAHEFEGTLELHLVDRYPLPDDLMYSGSRQYFMDDIEWIESRCYVSGGPFEVDGPSRSAQGSEPLVPDYQLKRDGVQGMDSTIILTSAPPPDCHTLSISGDSSPDPWLGGAFTARLSMKLVEGPAPSAAEWRDDLAMAIDQTFAAYGLFAVPHPDGVAIGSVAGFGDGFVLVMDRQPEP